MRCRGLLVAALVLLPLAGAPAHGQLINRFRDNIPLGLTDAVLAGTIHDYTHNHGKDCRIQSSILGMPRDLYVYLPPGYNPCNSYSLILYFHMGSVDEHTFIAAQIHHLDHMIRTGKIPPVIVACPDGTYGGENGTQVPQSMYVNGYGGRVEDHVMQEVVPFLMSRYSIRPERQAHGIIGCSAGGFGAMSLGIRRRDFFGAVATLAAPLNLRYYNVNCDPREDFDPCTYRWRSTYDPDEIAGVFYCGLHTTESRKYIEPVFGTEPGVPGRIAALNPADLIFTTGLRPGELAMYVNYPQRDNYNFDAHAESFAWLARSRGICVEVDPAPLAGHGLMYFEKNHRPAYQWLGAHLLPPARRAVVVCANTGHTHAG